MNGSQKRGDGFTGIITGDERVQMLEKLSNVDIKGINEEKY